MSFFCFVFLSILFFSVQFYSFIILFYLLLFLAIYSLSYYFADLLAYFLKQLILFSTFTRFYFTLHLFNEYTPLVTLNLAAVSALEYFMTLIMR